MHKKRRLIVLFIAIWFINSCGDVTINYHNDEQLYKKFYNALQPPVGKKNCGTYRINLSEVATFAWDSVYFFSGESGPIYMSHIVGYEWNGPAVPNLYTRLMFANQGRIVTFIDCPKIADSYKGEKSLNIIVFGCNPSRPVLSRDQAKFVTSNILESQLSSYPMVPIGCETESSKKLLLPDCLD